MSTKEDESTSSSIDDFFTMGRRMNQMTPEELSRVASEPPPSHVVRNRPVVMTSSSNRTTSSIDDFFTMGRRMNQMTPEELSRVASDPAPRSVRNRPVVMSSSSNATTTSSMDDFFTMSRRTNQMTPEELAMNKTPNDSNQQQIESSKKRTNNLHRALEIFQRLKSIDRQERALREERVKLQDELGAILIRQNK